MISGCPSGSETCESAVPRVYAPQQSEVRRRFAGKRFAEVFSGVGHLAKAFAREGIEAEAWDILHGSDADFLNPTVVERFKGRIKAGVYVAISFGLPCISWSRARRHDGKGPPPLRDDRENIMGFAGLSKKDQKKVDEGNLSLIHI